MTLLLLLSAVSLLKFRKADKRVRNTSLVLCDLFLLVLAVNVSHFSDHRNQPQYFAANLSHGDSVTLLAAVNELPVKRENWTRCELRVNALVRGDSVIRSGGRLLAYFHKDHPVLRPGQALKLNARLLSPESPKNPGEFDYKAWLERRNIFYTAFLRHNDYRFVQSSVSVNPIWQIGLHCRNWLLLSLRNSELTAANYPICAALLTGQDDEIDRITISAFAHSGTLHILSVSGLHVGLLYLTLNWLFRLFLASRKLRLVRLIMVLVSLWLFALMTGFAAPVLRSVIMFTLIGIGNIYFRNDGRNLLNLLCASAFVILFYQPAFLYDLGFLLSYFAMFGLIALTPWISGLYSPRYWLDDMAWKSIAASIAATVTTLPITLLFFKQFPMWFFLCNLVVVPLSFAVLLLSVLIVLKVPFVALLSNLLVDLMRFTISLVDIKGWGYIDAIDFNVTDAIFLTILLIAAALAFYTRSYKNMATALAVLVCWQLTALFYSFQVKSSNSLTVYHVNRSKSASIHFDRQLWYFCDDSAAVDFRLRPHFSMMNNAKLCEQRFCVAGGKRNVVVYANVGKKRRDASVLIVTGSYWLKEEEIKLFPSLKMLVCDGSASRKAVQQARFLSRKFGLLFHNTAELGALTIPL